MLPDALSIFDRPIIILAAPRSGSTLLFETLVQAPGIWTVGGESHHLIESFRALNPLFGQVESNRLQAEDTDPEMNDLLRRRFARSLRDRSRRRMGHAAGESSIRFLEKTPKNALRQPFLEQVFPGAFYLYLYREPRGNISSMVEAWRARRWVTYPRLPGWKGPPWSLLLPPGWQALNGRPLEEICAYQWATTNRIIVEDLARLPAHRWMACSYSELTGETLETTRGICDFAGLEMDDHLLNYLSAPLPLSRYTQTAPDAEKWRKNESGILSVLDQVSETKILCEQVLRQSSRA
jgi:hypothetical protein